MGGALLLCLVLPEKAVAWNHNLANRPAPMTATKAKQRTIVKVESIHVEAPVGTVPRLPWQVWVTYSDGTHEWRQTKWTNSLLSTEQQEANPDLYPIGKTYTINGYVIGDNTTESGFPITANVTVTAQPWDVPSPNPHAQPLPLNSVSLLGSNRLSHNTEHDIKHLLSLDISQQLYNYRDTYGLSTEGYTKADGWDSPTTKLNS